MNLSQLASFICTKVNQSETDDVAACKEFLKRRMEMIWNDDLWKDSLVAFTQVLSPDDYAVTNTWLPEKGVLLCPTIIERVVAARLDSRKMNVQRQEFYYRFDYDSFAKTGNATEFVLLPPCVWEFEEATELLMASSDSGDDVLTVTTDTLDSDGIEVTRNTTVISASTIATTERLDAVLKPVTTGAVAVQYQGSGTSCVLINNYASEVYFKFFNITPTLLFTEIVPAGGRATVNLTGVWAITATDSTGIPNYGEVVLSTTELGQVTFQSTGDFLESENITLLSIAAADLSAPLRQRIRLLNIPETEVTIRVLGKKKMPTFTSDLDSPPISGVTNCLLAFAQSDMLQRERQYGKSQAIAQEGMGLLEQLKRQEVVQQAHSIRIQPDCGFGGEYDFNSGGYSPLTF